MTRSVMLVDDEPAILRSVGLSFEKAGYEVFREGTGRGAVEGYVRHLPDVVVLDLQLPDVSGLEVLERLRTHEAVVILLTGHGDIEAAVTAMQLGAENFLTKPIDMPHLLVAVDRAFDKVRLRREVHLLKTRSGLDADLSALGVSPQMQEVERQVQLLAASPRTTVLLTGESGTGKGFVARMIHELSGRANEPFIDVNCGGLTATFLDSELFGHERGAFTDAKERKQGLFEIADRGTIFLDEIGDLAAELQPKLLKVLESKTFRRVGGTREICVDVRLIAATNQDLPAQVESGRFREDLFYRLSVLPLHLPPLRERTRDDRLALVQRLLADISAGATDGKGDIDTVSLERLLAYPWPGNVREMHNVLERAVILARGQSTISLEHLPVEIRRGGEGNAASRFEPTTLKDLERRHIERTLRFHKGNRTHTARELGISRATLIKKIQTFGLDS